MAIDHKIESFKYHYSWKNMLTKHLRSDFYLSSKHFDYHYLSEVDLFNTSVGVLRIRTPETQ